ncbi:MAG: hypothetical protein CBC11_008790 [Proteobacteria bacterium TMED51]|jgi:hypothetical protein|nr:MAG: hypothetical protein CBC11_008790 [Proteobacteria bacterium TMED51]|tara:strand:- start:2186 stop:2368 length:183 start_codon:yes stop_codon:yes gene_type:complete
MNDSEVKELATKIAARIGVTDGSSEQAICELILDYQDEVDFSDFNTGSVFIKHYWEDHIL